MRMKDSATSYAAYRTWTLTAAKNLTPGDCTAFSRTRAPGCGECAGPARRADLRFPAVHRGLFGVADWDGDGYADVIARNGTTGDLWLYPGLAARPLGRGPGCDRFRLGWVHSVRCG